MPKHIETILTSVGLPAEEVQKIVSLPEAEQEKFDVKPLVDKIKSNYQTQFQNDPAFFNEITIDKLPPATKKQMETDQYARAAGIVKQKFYRTLGLTENDLAGLTEEQKEKFESFVPAVAEIYAKTKAGDKEMQQQLIAERKKNEELSAKYGPDYEKSVESKYDQKVNAAMFHVSLVGELSTIPGLKIPASDIAATASQIIQSKYGFERIGDYGIELRQKANPQMKVLKNNSSHELTLKDALLEIATERGWIEAKNDDANSGGGVVHVIPGKDGLKAVIPNHVKDKMAKKLASEK